MALGRSGQSAWRRQKARFIGGQALWPARQQATGIKGGGITIKAEMRWFYPIDWPQLSRHVRFERAGGVCQGCGRPHELPPNWWTPLLSSDGSGKVSNGPGTASFYG